MGTTRLISASCFGRRRVIAVSAAAGGPHETPTTFKRDL